MAKNNSKNKNTTAKKKNSKAISNMTTNLKTQWQKTKTAQEIQKQLI